MISVVRRNSPSQEDEAIRKLLKSSVDLSGLFAILNTV